MKLNRYPLVPVLLFFSLFLLLGTVLPDNFFIENQLATPSGSEEVSMTRLNQELKTLDFKKIKSTQDLDQLRQKVLTRAKSLTEIAKSDPRLFLTLAFSTAERAKFPRELQAEIEQEVFLSEVTLDTFHLDNFETQTSHYDNFLTISDQSYNFYPTEELALLSGTKIKLNKAYLLGKSVIADINHFNFEILQPASALDAVGDQKTLVLLINFPDSGPPPLTVTEAHNLVFNSQFKNFYQEQSYGQVSFSGEVHGWYTWDLGESCDIPSLTNPTIVNLIADQGINLANYKRLIFLVDSLCLGQQGVSSLGKKDLVINGTPVRISESTVSLTRFNEVPPWSVQPFAWTSADFLLSHELGHALGLVHAGGWDCQEAINSGTCNHVEYGNTFDTMGLGSYSLQFNAFYKKILGWLGNSSVSTINESGRYHLAPLEASTGVRLAKIEAPTGQEFFLEYRRGLGFDSKLNEPAYVSNQDGLFVNRLDFIPLFGRLTSHLLDLAPTALPWNDDLQAATLNVGSAIFNDPESGVKIGPVVSKTDDEIIFDVTVTPIIVNDCVRVAPLITHVNYPNLVLAGQSYSLTVNFINKDMNSCPASSFTLSPHFPVGWEQGTDFSLISLAPGQSGVLSVDLVVPPNASPGVYNVLLEITNSDPTIGLSQTESVFIEVDS